MDDNENPNPDLYCVISNIFPSDHPEAPFESYSRLPRGHLITDQVRISATRFEQVVEMPNGQTYERVVHETEALDVRDPSGWVSVDTPPPEGETVDVWAEYVGRLTSVRLDQGVWWQARRPVPEDLSGKVMFWRPVPAPPSGFLSPKTPDAADH